MTIPMTTQLSYLLFESPAMGVCSFVEDASEADVQYCEEGIALKLNQGMSNLSTLL